MMKPLRLFRERNAASASAWHATESPLIYTVGDVSALTRLYTIFWKRRAAP
jgi:hypothetical protein